MKRLSTYFSLVILLACNSKTEEVPQEDNWVLKNKKVFTDQLNSFGLPDTTYTKMYTYENLNVKDSSEMFAVSQYDNDRRLISKSFYLANTNGSPSLQSQSKFVYAGKNLVGMVDEASGVLTKHERYVYDTSGKLLSSSIIRLKNFDKIFQRSDNDILQKQELEKQGYDTLNITYKYDASNKNIGGEMLDNRGNLVRKDVNIYSGSAPISTYNFGPNGDTLQHITYVQQGNKLTSQIENKDFIVATAMNSGLVTGKLTLNKKTNEKLRQEWTYDRGRLAEEKFYVNENKKK